MTRVLGEPLIRRERVGSTMDEVAYLAGAGAPEGTAVLADEQTAGRGRAGRPWVSPPGMAILLSVLLRPSLPATRVSALPLVMGAAVAEAIEAFAGVRPRLKWPNDVWLDGGKVAGILTTTRTDGRKPFVVVGIGLNVNTPAETLPSGATSLLVAAGRRHDREAMLAVLFDRLEECYRALTARGGTADLSGWRSRALFLGEPVTVAIAGTLLTGVFRDVDSGGALLLAQPDGSTRRIVAGDLARGPSPVVGSSPELGVTR